MSIKRIAAAGAFVGLLFGAAAMAETAKTQTAPQTTQTWAPPAEISNKPAAPAPAATPGAPTASAGAATAAPTSKADKEKDCVAQAKAKHLRKGPRWSFIEECMKQ